MNAPVTNRIQTTRRTNLKALAAKYGHTALSKMCGYSGPSWISQLTGPKADRPVTDHTVARVETALNLERGWMDIDHDGLTDSPNAEEIAKVAVISQEENRSGADNGRDALRLIYRELEKHGIALELEKFVIVARVMMRDMQHVGTLDTELLLDLLRLADALPEESADS